MQWVSHGLTYGHDPFCTSNGRRSKVTSLHHQYNSIHKTPGSSQHCTGSVHLTVHSYSKVGTGGFINVVEITVLLAMSPVSSSCSALTALVIFSW